ncbi:pentatricopeptide repeat-containing protein At4g39952, mitochondrial [Phalaenopsis equestris]|uniref:pentatricopeptide repeat-containing protein At4g39952, mitochondrial n=1 Tax=Phalaenopsis equestris TaxID=78828 RepID=UPI0009E3FC89|nr:pentatricopeptide repeat-containing protein At4g39952, mitochondrial [Phalaenopsis equestris]
MLCYKPKLLRNIIALVPGFHLHCTASSSLSCLPPNSVHLLISTAVQDHHSVLLHHGAAITSGHSSNPFLAAKLISLYASLHRPDFAVGVFSSSIPQNLKDKFLWNSIIKAHFSNADYTLSLLFFRQMLAAGVPPDQFTFPMVFSASAELRLLYIGSCMHGICIQNGLLVGKSGAVGSSLIFMYSKCGIIGDAFKAFDEISERDVVAWTALIIGCVRNGDSELGLICLSEMHRLGKYEGASPNSRTLDGGLQACANLGALIGGKCLHGFLLKTGSGCLSSVRSSLLSMYAKCESFEETVLAFEELPERDTVSWTEVLSVYAKKGLFIECLKLFQGMIDSKIELDGVSLSCMLLGFANSCCVHGGKAFHAIILRKNFGFSEPVVCSLLMMYCKLGQLGTAETCFSFMGRQSAETWNLMIGEYEKIGLDIKCLDLFREMQFYGLGVNINQNTVVHLLSSCSKLNAFRLGQSLHCYTIKNSLNKEDYISNSLICLYGRCGKLILSKRVFQRSERNIVSYNALISAYYHLGHSGDALNLFNQMIFEGMKPNSSTLLSVISACSDVAALDFGKRIHGFIREMGLECEVSICTALLDMYAKCGHLETSRALFDSMPERDVISWNAMISAYGIHGDAEKALEVFREMESSGIKPNRVTFLAALWACSHVGFVEEARRLFLRMKDYGFTPNLKHYACMIDVLARSGNLLEAEAMILSMPVQPDGGIWGALLGACYSHSNVEMGEYVGHRALECDPENDGFYILVSNILGRNGRWER